MSKRVDSRSFELPHRGQSLGVEWVCFRFFTASRKFWSIRIGVPVAPGGVSCCCLGCFIVFLCCLLGSLVVVLGSWIRGLGGRLGV